MRNLSFPHQSVAGAKERALGGGNEAAYACVCVSFWTLTGAAACCLLPAAVCHQSFRMKRPWAQALVRLAGMALPVQREGGGGAGDGGFGRITQLR